MSTLTENHPPTPSGADGEQLHALRWGITFREADGALTLQLNGESFCFAGLPAPALHRIITRLDGGQAAAAVAEQSAVKVDLVEAIVGLLAEQGLVRDFSRISDSRLEPERFAAVCRELFAVWRQRLGQHALFGLLGSGRATRAQFLGWLLENYHFIEGIHDRLALAISECDDPGFRVLLAQHYSEEHDHSHYFMSSLETLGLEAEAVASSRPLPGTTAVLDFMRQCGRRDSLQYGICTAFFEATGGTREYAEASYGALMNHYTAEHPEAITPLVEHVALDNACGHESMLDEMLAQVGPVSLTRATAALGACAQMVEALDLWTTDIMRAYDRPDFALRDGSGEYRPNTPAPNAGNAGGDSLQAFEAECRFRAEEIFRQPFWTTMLSGQAHRGLILGWGVELFHFVEAANEYMAAAVAFCRGDSKARRWLADRYFESHHRGELLLRGLGGLARPERVRSAPPLASTRALVNFLRELATTDWLAFTGALGVVSLVRTGMARAEATPYYETLKGHYPDAEGLLDPVAQYARTLAPPFGPDGLPTIQLPGGAAPLSAESARRMTLAARDAYEHFVLFFEGLMDYYGDAYAFVPRQSFDIRLVL